MNESKLVILVFMATLLAVCSITRSPREVQIKGLSKQEVKDYAQFFKKDSVQKDWLRP